MEYDKTKYKIWTIGLTICNIGGLEFGYITKIVNSSNKIKKVEQ